MLSWLRRMFRYRWTGRTCGYNRVTDLRGNEDPLTREGFPIRGRVHFNDGGPPEWMRWRRNGADSRVNSAGTRGSLSAGTVERFWRHFVDLGAPRCEEVRSSTALRLGDSVWIERIDDSGERMRGVVIACRADGFFSVEIRDPCPEPVVRCVKGDLYNQWEYSHRSNWARSPELLGGCEHVITHVEVPEEREPAPPVA